MREQQSVSAICSAFKGGKQQEAIIAKIPAQAAWSESWKSMDGIDPPRGFAFAWFKIGNEDIAVYSVHLKSNLITRGDRDADTAKNIRKREVAIAQLLTHIRDVIGTTMPTIRRCDGGRLQHKSRSGNVRGGKNTRFPG
jgi:hypothetical protein